MVLSLQGKGHYFCWELKKNQYFPNRAEVNTFVDEKKKTVLSIQGKSDNFYWMRGKKNYIPYRAKATAFVDEKKYWPRLSGQLSLILESGKIQGCKGG